MPEKSKTDLQPVSKIKWIHRDLLVANDYNPNNVFTPEMHLLKVSLLDDGWTIPLVVAPIENGKYEIIDGFHRWTLSAMPDVFAMTDGFVPCTILEITDRARQMMSTIRYNRARGVHHVVKMANIVEYMEDNGVAKEVISKKLGMEVEEVERLEQKGKMTLRGSKPEFNKGKIPSVDR